MSMKDRNSAAESQTKGSGIEPTGHAILRNWPLSDLDRAIIAHLQEDGRRPFITIARDLDVSERTVRNRVHQLLDTNVIQIVALTSPSALGYHAGALVGIKSDPAVPASEIAVELTAIPDVDYVVVTTGRFTLFAEIISRDISTMQRVVERQIGKIAGVTAIEVFPYFSVFYQKAKFFARSDASPRNGAVRAKPLEDIDKAIAAELSHNGRAPLKAVAEKVGISETQVRMRVNDMISSGQMNVMAIINPMNLDNKQIAWLGIRVNSETSPADIAERISAISHISYIAICAGRYDLFVEIVCPSRDDLFTALNDSVRKIKGVVHIEPFLYIDLHYKRLVPVAR